MHDDASHRWERRQIDAAIAKIEEFRDRCAPAAERYERLGALWGRLHVSLGLPAAVLAAVAGVAALGDFSKTVSGVVALSAAALSATTTFLGGADRQRAAKARADALRELATEADNYLSVDALDPYHKLDAPYLFKDFNERLAAVRAGQPLPEMWWRGRPGHALNSGDDVSWLMD
jgi:hypothetical protein